MSKHKTVHEEMEDYLISVVIKAGYSEAWFRSLTKEQQRILDNCAENGVIDWERGIRMEDCVEDQERRYVAATIDDFIGRGEAQDN